MGAPSRPRQPGSSLRGLGASHPGRIATELVTSASDVVVNDSTDTISSVRGPALARNAQQLLDGLPPCHVVPFVLSVLEHSGGDVDCGYRVAMRDVNQPLNYGVSKSWGPGKVNGLSQRVQSPRFLELARRKPGSKCARFVFMFVRCRFDNLETPLKELLEATFDRCREIPRCVADGATDEVQ